MDSDQRVRILTIDGKISGKNYIHNAEKPDRKGLVIVTDPQNGSQIKVNHKRILRGCDDDGALVLSFGDKHRAVCVRCSYVAEIEVGNEWLECPTHGLVKLYWKESRPRMNNKSTDTIARQESSKQEKDSKIDKRQKAESAKQPTPKHSAPIIPFDDIARNPSLELWTKKNIQFDHAKMDVRAHVILFVGDLCRKMCFNSYDGTAGKKDKALPLDAFLSNQPEGLKKQWYDVKDLEATRKKLAATGYEIHRV